MSGPSQPNEGHLDVAAVKQQVEEVTRRIAAFAAPQDGVSAGDTPRR